MPPAAEISPSLSDKAVHILSAAERCFARQGFHQASMQDIAREAQMSPGNLYRYFPSKAEMVAGLIERDRAKVAEMLEIVSAHEDFRAGFLAMCRGFLVEEPLERILLWIEIWSEAARNPAVAEVTLRCDCEAFDHLERAFERARTRGQLPAAFDLEAFLYLLRVISDGLLVQRGLFPDFDAERALALLEALLGAVASGGLKLPPSDKFKKSSEKFKKSQRARTRKEKIS